MAKAKTSPIRLLCTLLLVALLGYFCYMYINQGIVLSNQRKQIEQMAHENSKLEERYQESLKSIEDKNTLDYIDRYMRDHFGMVQEGEIRVDVVEGQ